MDGKYRIKEKNRKKYAYVIGVTFFCAFFLFIQAVRVNAEEKTAALAEKIEAVHGYVLSVDHNPTLENTWYVIGTKRSDQGAPTAYTNTYYHNLLENLVENNWVLTRSKYTEYSKLILGMTAIGVDAADVGGHNLFQYLSDFSQVKKQGVNGPIWALLALNSHPSYTIPQNASAAEQTTEEGIIRYLLSRQIRTADKGYGWSLKDVADPDVTGMAIQALAPYYLGEKVLADPVLKAQITVAIDSSLDWLSAVQIQDSGGYQSMGAENMESCAQVIMGLVALGIDPEEDLRFRKNGRSVLDAMLSYYLPGQGGFCHVKAGGENNGGGNPGELNGMATEQGLYTMVAYTRMKAGMSGLFVMRDQTLFPGSIPPDLTHRPAQGGTEPGKGNNQTVVIKRKVSGVFLNYQSVTVEKGKTKKLKASVRPTDAANKKIKWKSSDHKIVEVTQKGKVKGIRAGKAKIIAKAKDGSGKKAVCVVTVLDNSPETVPGKNISRPSTPAENTGNTAAPANPAGAETKTAGGETKTAGKETKTVGKNTQTNGQTKEESKEEGWSFDGDTYTPETYEEEEEEKTTEQETEKKKEEEGFFHKTITLNIPVGRMVYLYLRCAFLAGIGFLVWLTGKKIFFRK